ncbi:MAG: 1-(5-phosphoribosyl)-5-[(5-phosphoribosylamino)methylideneamino] imidazole-4-carboxamide isomerase [Reichenbachiella sp.]|uniref:1-(5-phosphoribosyl)-5-[(5- phosphoribosylamino)methylideneamino]imidazole-4- carboxamide isomerase n=1 Tax=Reichenbachiella sp. TaxID=2184521 RepID=UPI0032655090
MLLVPSISIKDGKVTRLTRGDYTSGKIYNESPIDLARQFEDHGINRLHLIDLDGAKKGTPVNYHILEMMSGYSDIAINFSGGIHTDGDITKCFEFGAESITSATIAVYNPDMFSSWMMSYGREKIALGADTLDGLIRVGGWQKGTKIDLFEHIDYFYSRGLKYLKTTDISREGAMEGPSFGLYQQVIEKFPNLCLFASGGIRSVDDIQHLQDIGVYGVIFGKAFYEGKITLKDIEGFAVGVN